MPGQLFLFSLPFSRKKSLLNCPTEQKSNFSEVQFTMARFFTVKEVANTLRRHPRTIYRWLDEDFLRGKKVKDGWLIPHEEVERVLRSAPEDDAV